MTMLQQKRAQMVNQRRALDIGSFLSFQTEQSYPIAPERGRNKQMMQIILLRFLDTKAPSASSFEMVKI
ncbi:hypothetical protein BAE42_30520 [Mesorhizobium loti]|uniref:Uncharacterized protein n=1 Tax=Mesorhizobium erdmanii TaxID=1777866 RepID=A0A6M7UTE3_9HYPH|nr:hypothetical protein BAE42_30520 [Mesorhizobium loti]OBQ63774.1 hypothetical protein A8146_30930 [Mesorhizobium loti]QKC79210.1 hypothetical protein EB233_30170 [Mesorhizobium erdmanii]